MMLSIRFMTFCKTILFLLSDVEFLMGI